MAIDSFTLARTIFLIFVIFVSVYFIIENKKPQSVEKYEDSKPSSSTSADTTTKTLKPANDPQKPAPSPAPPSPLSNQAEIEKEIMTIYKELYQTAPSKEELEFYKDYASTRKITRDQLKDVIQTSAPTLQKTFYSNKFANTPDEIFGSENEIIEIYNEILMRNPDRRELYNHAQMMKNDSTFTMDKLRQVLIASEEFKRMERTQNNHVYMNLQSNITDRQLTLQVTQLYIDVTGQEYVDEDTLKFLKRKFVEFDLNEKTMMEFIKAYVSKKPFDMQPNKVVKQDGASSAKLTEEQMQELKKSLADELKKTNESSSKQSTTKTDSSAASAAAKGSSAKTPKEAFDGKTVINDSQIYNFFGTDAANKQVISSLMQDSTTPGGKVDTDNILTKIRGGDCAYNKNAAEIDMLSKNKQELSQYIDERNRSHMKSLCQRNKRYINADEDMVLFPEFKWSVPQEHPPVCVGGNSQFNPTVSQTALIGTLLPDAQDTSVGSILPVFPPV